MCSSDLAFYLADGTSSSLMMSQSATITNSDGTQTYKTVWDFYVENGFAPLYAKMADLLYYSYVDSKATPDKAEVFELMMDVRALSDDALRIFSFIGADITGNSNQKVEPLPTVLSTP